MHPYALLTGDTLQQMATLPEQSVQCVITSPPYWGLRDYGTDGQIGLEQTPDKYVAKMVEVFQGVWRVLRDDGTVWLNLGDSYASNPASGGRSKSSVFHGSGKEAESDHQTPTRKYRQPLGLKPKDLCMIPARVAIALQADGWYLRQEIVWHKPNPMPESVRDRCTRAHEMVYMLTKKPKYYYDAEAIKEPSTGQGGAAADFKRTTKDHLIPGQSAIQHRLDRKPTEDNGKRNRRTVWTVTAKPFKEAHFATFPPDLVRPMIQAGCPEGGTVLDPFSGAATTGLVCIEDGRAYIGIELSPEYQAIAEKRLAGAQQTVQDTKNQLKLFSEEA